MKKIIVLCLLTTYMIANNNLSITGLAYSDHKNKNMNESHNWIGLKYDYNFDSKLSLGLELASFKNSYSEDTKSIGINMSWLPLEIGNLKVGPTLLVGYQKGYCFDGIFKTIYCNDNNKNSGLLVIPSLQIQYDINKYYTIGTNISSNGDDYFARFFITLIKW